MNLNDELKGLTEKEVRAKREKYGSNIINRNTKNSFIKLFIESLGDPIIKILLIALAVKTVFLFQNFDWFETLGIVIAILLASLISSISEYGSEKAFEKMQEETSKIKCKVKREVKLQEISIDEVVKDDIVFLTSGDFVPADGIIIDDSLTLDESSFTGEAKDVEKQKKDEVYRGSTVLNGSAYIRINNVGNDTKYGKIALELQEKNPESPLKMRLKKLADTISKIGYIGAILVSISYLFSVIFIENGFDFSVIKELITTPKVIFGHMIYALTLSVTIIIVSVPEGLPMMVALILSSNMKKMIKNNVLVRRMVGIETAGSINTLFSDKTGTITKGQIEVAGVVLPNGKILKNLNEFSKSLPAEVAILENMRINNEAKLDDNGKIIGGNITDRAILEFTKSINFKVPVKNRKIFNSKDKYSSVLIGDVTQKELIKGAPEVLLPKISNFISNKLEKVAIDKSVIKTQIDRYTNLGYRVILLAERNNKYSDQLSYQGFIILKDEVQPTAKEAVQIIHNAGIHFIMITGDSKDTALSIGKEIGLIKSNNDLILTSNDINKMTDDEIKSIFPKIKIIARALPTDKSRLVKIGQSLNEVIGMTGDGVNDAPALKCADVGFAMGSGSEVAKEASDVVILDNNLLSITKAILFGRTIFKSLRKFIIFQLTMNLSALTLSILGPFLRINTPVTVMQMLWINMIMDTLAGLAFSFEPALEEYIKEKPKKKEEHIMNNYMYTSILFTGLYNSLLLILFLKLPFFRNIFRYDINDKYIMTAFFGLFVFTGVMNSLNARTKRINVFANITKNIPFIIIIIFIIFVQILLLYFGQNIFRTYGLNLKEFGVMFILSLSVIPVDVIRKYFVKKAYIK